ncbi:uncharacterized protein E0L32_005274 [Thyridium curvatum]|uniref:Tubulin-tyrosine ligase n=1 Tax=Thyridium curvatum TaxID=1093900 RepID=A0A507AX98_9PEZI|nr:uncharacterized protein E0L32_005274 [Thyridium curvatum]TPX14582.1 hypothetical protein E0L32_005274 [Thyridium curvatum]
MHAYVRSANSWLDEHIRAYIQKHIPDVTFIHDVADLQPGIKKIFQYADGWELNQHFAVLNASEYGLINAYPSSDALARKDLLAQVVDYWSAKRPDTILRTHSPQTIRLTLDYAEYVDDALMAADDLTLYYSLQENEDKDPSEREWWILKAALCDCGAGIRIFSTMEELANNLELVEFADDTTEEYTGEEEAEEKASKGPEASAKDDEQLTNGHKDGQNGDDTPETEGEADSFKPNLSIPGLSSLDALVTASGKLSLEATAEQQQEPAQKSKEGKIRYTFKEDERIPSAQLREFVAQRYIVRVPTIEKRKWHVRAYVLSVGRLKVHVFRECLALLALKDYEPPWENPSLTSSLTNTSLQEEDEFIANNSMRDFWADFPDDMVPALGAQWKERVFEQMCSISSETFRAAAYTMGDRFTPLDKCFELFALDFLVDDDGVAWLLEVNETPAFYEHGVAGPMAKRLMESVICLAMEHLGAAQKWDQRNAEVRARMVEVLDETSTLAKSNIREIVPEDWK